MTTEPHNPSPAPPSVEVPAPTAWPLVLGFGVALLAAGLPLGLPLSVVGGVLFVVGLVGWVRQVLPGVGHAHEPVAEKQPAPVKPRPGTVEQLKPGMPGYRFRLPLHVHPISAGIKGGLVGGLLMPIPALLYGLISGKGLFYPVNLLAGMALPGLQGLDLSQFYPGLFFLAVVIHVVFSAGLGLMYGVMLPTLPTIPRPLAWGGLLFPILWSAVSFSLMGVVNPVLNQRVDWPWFLFSQFVFGVVAAVAVMQLGKLRPVTAGAIAGAVGGALMTVPALLWGLITGHGIWYPVNLLAGTVLPGLGTVPADELKQFHADWFVAALVVHAFFSIGFGVVYGLVLTKLPDIPGPLSWGGLLMPLLWTAGSHALLGVINPTLEQRVDWPWFVVSQFVFGVAAAVVVLRSAQVPVPPAGEGRPPGRTP